MTTPETPPASRSVSWKWALFGLGIVVVVVLLVVVSLDRANVVWEGGEPVCPHCRSDVALYSARCATCRQGYDWTTDERLCDLCLSEGDVAAIRAVPEADRKSAATSAFPGDAHHAWALLEWWKNVRPGACVHCAGTEKDLFAQPATAGGGLKALPPCPVCFEDGDCILCGGDERVTVGEPAAHRDRQRYQERRAYLQGRLGRPAENDVADAAEDGVASLRGRDEVRAVVGTDGRYLVDVAELRRAALLKLLPVPTTEE